MVKGLKTMVRNGIRIAGQINAPSAANQLMKTLFEEKVLAFSILSVVKLLVYQKYLKIGLSVIILMY